MRHLFEGDGSLVVANLYNYLDSYAVRTVILFFLQKKSEILCLTDVKNRILYLNLQKRVRWDLISTLETQGFRFPATASMWISRA
jgi:hypothetical protein